MTGNCNMYRYRKIVMVGPVLQFLNLFYRESGEGMHLPLHAGQGSVPNFLRKHTK